MALFICLSFLAFPSCQKDELNQDSIPDMDLISSSTVSQNSSPIFYYAPDPFPIGLSQVKIENEYYKNFGNTFVLKVQNGTSNSDPKASTVEIKINGRLIIKSSDFNNVNLVIKKINGLTYGSTLEVKVENTEMTSITLWIEGTLIKSLQGKIKDVEGNTYKTVKIGDQWWMAENLKVAKYRNGVPIESETNAELWQSESRTTGFYCWYMNDPVTYNDYGILYNGVAVDDSRQLCPTGWHVPTYDEWTKLFGYLGGENIAGLTLKETGTSHWESPNFATNVSGFSAFGGGTRYEDGSFSGNGRITYFWSSSKGAFSNHEIIYIINDYTNVTSGEANSGGLSVRCIKGEGIPQLAVGQSYQGGIIAYILQPNDHDYVDGETHGLIAASSDQSTGIIWYNESFTSTGAIAAEMGSGNANTDAIVASQGEGSYAAKLCYDLNWNGFYLDWYLPSKEELNKLYLNKTAIGGFSNASYWSSTEYDSNKAWSMNFADSENPFGVDDKSMSYMVRAVRSF